jgi:hypothetical protein
MLMRMAKLSWFQLIHKRNIKYLSDIDNDHNLYCFITGVILRDLVQYWLIKVDKRMIKA